MLGWQNPERDHVVKGWDWLYSRRRDAAGGFFRSVKRPVGADHPEQSMAAETDSSTAASPLAYRHAGAPLQLKDPGATSPNRQTPCFPFHLVHPPSPMTHPTVFSCFGSDQSRAMMLTDRRLSLPLLSMRYRTWKKGGKPGFGAAMLHLTAGRWSLPTSAALLVEECLKAMHGIRRAGCWPRLS